MTLNPAQTEKYQNNTIRFKERRVFITAVLIACLVFLFAAGAEGAGTKKEPLQKGFHYKASYQFKISARATDEITVIRNIPRTSNHQKITGEKFTFPEPGELTTCEIGLNSALVYRLNKNKFLEYCRRGDKNSGGTLEITYECDYLGLSSAELDEKFPFSLYKMKKGEKEIIARKVMAVLGVLELADLSASTDETAVRLALEKIFYYIDSNVSYTRDKQKRGPLFTIDSMRGNCISKTNLWRAMLSALKIRSCDVSGIILKKKNHDVTHRFSVVLAAGKKVPFCPTNKRFAKLPPHYMVLSFVKKDNRASGASPLRVRFDITELKNSAVFDQEPEEHLGVAEGASEPYEER